MLCSLFFELHLSVVAPPTFYCNNHSAQCLAKNPIQHAHTKYIKFDQYFIHDQVLRNQLLLEQVSSNNQVDNILTNAFALSSVPFTQDQTYGLSKTTSLKGDVKLCDIEYD